MSDKSMSRRKFLVGAGAVLGAASVSGLALANRPSAARAAGAALPLPWPYAELDAEAVARRAYEVFYVSACAEATWWPIVEALLAANPDTWGTLPQDVLKFGGGGVGGWGTICGTLTGSSAIIAMTGAPGKLTDAAMQYYAETPLPTNGIDKAVRAGWAPAAGLPTPLPNVPTSTAHSQLCHASLSQWTMTTGAEDASRERKDRCAKACYDMAFKTVTMLNAWHADPANVPTVTLDSSIAACQTACHTTPIAKGKMACDSCHDQTPDHASVQ